MISVENEQINKQSKMKTTTVDIIFACTYYSSEKEKKKEIEIVVNQTFCRLLSIYYYCNATHIIYIKKIALWIGMRNATV